MYDYRTITARPEMQTRDKTYALEMCKYFYGQYAANRCMIGPNGGIHEYSQRTFKELRDHGKGVQDPSRYRDQIDPPKRKGNAKKYNMNISWEISRHYERYKSILKSKFQELILTPKIDATSNDAVLEKDFIKNFQKLMVSPEMQTFMEGASYSPPEISAQSPDDVDVLDQLGGIRLEREIIAKDVADVVLRNSGFESIAPLVIDDFIDLSIASMDYDVINGVGQYLYVDPATLIIPRSFMEDYRDTDYRGYWSYPTIAEVKAKFKDINLDEIKAVAGIHFSWGEKWNYAKIGGQRESIKVVTMYWMEYDNYPVVTGKKKNGIRQFEMVEPGFKLSERGQKQGKQIEEYDILRLYKAQWVVGTEVILEFGPVDVMARDKDRIIFPLTVFCTQRTSVTENVIPFDDELQLSIFKLRTLKAKIAPGPRMVIWKDVIMDMVSIGEDNFSIKDLLHLYQTEGIFVLERNPDFLENMNLQNLKPIEFLPSGVGEDFALLQQDIINQISNIRSMTGLNELVDGATPDMLKTVAMGLQQASNSIIRPLLATYVNFYKGLVRYVILRQQQTVLAYGEQKLKGLKVVSNSKDFGDEEFLVDVQVESQETKNLIMQTLMERREAIPPESFLLVINTLEQNDLKKAQFLLMLAITKSEQRAHQRQIEVQQAVAKGNADAGVAVENARAQNAQQSSQLELQKIQAEKELGFEDFLKRFPYEMQKIEKQAAMSHAQAVDVVRENNASRLEQ